MEKRTYFEVVVGEPTNGYEVIDFNKKCNSIEDMFGDFIGFSKNDKDGDILLRVIHKDKILQIKNIGTEE